MDIESALKRLRGHGISAEMINNLKMTAENIPDSLTVNHSGLSTDDLEWMAVWLKNANLRFDHPAQSLKLDQPLKIEGKAAKKKSKTAFVSDDESENWKKNL